MIPLGRGALIVAIVACLAFGAAVSCGFVSLDDDVYVCENPRVLDGLSPAGIDYALRSVVASNWAPLTILSYQIDASMYGRNAWGFHLTNVLVHSLAAALLFVALARMTDRPGPALAAALIWAVHPLRVESVAWISERKDVLSVACLALGLVCYERYCRRPSVAGMAMVTTVMLAGLLCKASLVVMPGLLVVLDAWPLRRLALVGAADDRQPSKYPSQPWPMILWEKVPLCVLSLLFVAITLRSQASAMSAESRLPLLAARLPNVVHGTVWYALKTILPTHLHPVRMHRGAEMPLASVALCVVVIMVVLVLAWRLRQSRPYFAAGVIWYLVALAPVSGIIQVGAHGTADRHSYIPQIGLVVAIVWTAADVATTVHAGRLAAAATAGIVAACIGIDLTQIKIWSDTESLWKHVLSSEPDNFIAHDHLGNLWHTRRHFENTEHHYLEALRTSNQRPRFIANLAWLYYDVGDLARAQAYRDWALRVGPRDPDVRRMVAHVNAPLPRGDSSKTDRADPPARSASAND